jgi:hypothetical protein
MGLLPVVVLGTGVGVLAAAIGWWLAPLDPGALALQMGFTGRAFGRVVHAWTIDELARYRAHLAPDTALLLAYGAWGRLLATRCRCFAVLSPGWRRAARWWMPAAAVCDAVENGLHAWLTAVPRLGVTLPYAATALASAMKWLLLLSFALLVSVLSWRAAADRA